MTTPKRAAGPVRAGPVDRSVLSFPSRQDIQELRRTIAGLAVEIARLRANLTCPACRTPPPHLTRSTEDYRRHHTCGNARTVRMKDPEGNDLEYRGVDGAP